MVLAEVYQSRYNSSTSDISLVMQTKWHSSGSEQALREENEVLKQRVESLITERGKCTNCATRKQARGCASKHQRLNQWGYYKLNNVIVNVSLPTTFST